VAIAPSIALIGFLGIVYRFCIDRPGAHQRSIAEQSDVIFIEDLPQRDHPDTVSAVNGALDRRIPI
jgi:hypothetical protein